MTADSPDYERVDKDNNEAFYVQLRRDLFAQLKIHPDGPAPFGYAIIKINDSPADGSQIHLILIKLKEHARGTPRKLIFEFNHRGPCYIGRSVPNPDKSSSDRWINQYRLAILPPAPTYDYIAEMSAAQHIGDVHPASGSVDAERFKMTVQYHGNAGQPNASIRQISFLIKDKPRATSFATMIQDIDNPENKGTLTFYGPDHSVFPNIVEIDIPGIAIDSRNIDPFWIQEFGEPSVDQDAPYFYFENEHNPNLPGYPLRFINGRYQFLHPGDEKVIISSATNLDDILRTNIYKRTVQSLDQTFMARYDQYSFTPHLEAYIVRVNLFYNKIFYTTLKDIDNNNSSWNGLHPIVEIKRIFQENNWDPRSMFSERHTCSRLTVFFRIGDPRVITNSRLTPLTYQDLTVVMYTKTMKLDDGNGELPDPDSKGPLPLWVILGVNPSDVDYGVDIINLTAPFRKYDTASGSRMEFPMMVCNDNLVANGRKPQFPLPGIAAYMNYGSPEIPVTNSTIGTASATDPRLYPGEAMNLSLVRGTRSDRLRIESDPNSLSDTAIIDENDININVVIQGPGYYYRSLVAGSEQNVILRLLNYINKFVVFGNYQSSVKIGRTLFNSIKNMINPERREGKFNPVVVLPHYDDDDKIDPPSLPVAQFIEYSVVTFFFFSSSPMQISMMGDWVGYLDMTSRLAGLITQATNDIRRGYSVSKNAAKDDRVLRSLNYQSFRDIHKDISQTGITERMVLGHLCIEELFPKLYSLYITQKHGDRDNVGPSARPKRIVPVPPVRRPRRIAKK